MCLKIELVDNVDVFNWEDMCCPLCGSKEFVSLSHAGVYCGDCNARFSVRHTAGDPGCVVDCFCTNENGGLIYAPRYRCPECQTGHSLFDWEVGDLKCTASRCDGTLVKQERVSGAWTPPKEMEKFCLILKLGDYCSGWMDNGSSTRKSSARFTPTQKQWDAYQEKIERQRDAVQRKAERTEANRLKKAAQHAPASESPVA